MSEKELHTHGTDCACGHNHHHHDDGCCGCGHDHAHEDIDKKAFLRKFAPGLLLFAGRGGGAFDPRQREQRPVALC